jgi:hypothetical protein
LAAAAVFALLAVPGAAYGAVSFSKTAYPLPAAGNTSQAHLGAVSMVDLNSDNHPDVVVSRGGSGLVVVLLNLGDGTFDAAKPYTSCSGSDDGGRLVSGQFSADQFADVIVSCDTGVLRLLGQGDGTLTSGTITQTNAGPLALWPADDAGFSRLLYSVYDSTAPATVLCDAPVNDLGGSDAECLPDTSHLDGGGGPDGHASISSALTTAHLYSTACSRDDVILSTYLNEIRGWGLNPADPPGAVNSCGSFSYASHVVQATPAVTKLTQLSAADLSGDASPDLLMTDASGPTIGDPGRLLALLWQGGSDMASGFPPSEQAVSTPSIAGIEDQRVADFDGDGHLDAAVAGANGSDSTGTLALHRGHGDGGFDAPPLTFAVPGGADLGAIQLAAGDLNGDSKPDIVSIAKYDGSVTVLLNSSGTPPPQHTLTVTTSGEGAGTVAGAGIDCGRAGHTDCSETVAEGATITLRATPAPGSSFAGFRDGGCGAATPCAVTMDADRSVAAQFDRIPVQRRTLTVTTSGSGSGTVTAPGIDCGGAGHVDCSETVVRGRTLTLAATAASDSKFGGFTGGGCGSTSPCTVALDADKAVAARFTLRPTDPTGPFAFVCPLLRRIRGQFSGIPHVGPFVSGIIDRLLAQFGCVPAEELAAARATAPHLQTGTGRADHIRGGSRTDVQAGRGGNDRLSGRGARDVMLGERGRDRLDGGPGGDVLVGGPGNDRLKGGAGTDVLSAGPGRDLLTTRDGARDYVSCGAGRDRVVADKRDVLVRGCERVRRRK